MFWSQKEDLGRAQVLMGERGSFVRDDSEIKEQELFSPDGGLLDSLCFHGNISRSERQRIILFVICSSLVVLILAALSRGLLLPAVMIPSAIGLWWASRRAYKRAENFERDYPAFLLSLASSVRTGVDPLSGLLESEKLFEPEAEIRKELYRFKLAIEQGKPEIEAIQQFASSIRHPDVQLFRTGYLLARREGSSLAECLQRLAKVTRQRQSFRRKIRSSVAMQRLSAFGIGGCAILITLIQTLGNPKIISDALAHPLGQRLMILGAVLILGGLAWMTKMTRSRI